MSKTTNKYSPEVRGLMDALLTVMLNEGLDEDASTHAAFNLLYYVVGFGMEEQAFLQKYGNPTSSEREATRSSFEILLNSEHGAVRQCLESILGSNFDKRFELGITVHIQGVKRLAAGH